MHCTGNQFRYSVLLPELVERLCKNIFIYMLSIAMYSCLQQFVCFVRRNFMMLTDLGKINDIIFNLSLTFKQRICLCKDSDVLSLSTKSTWYLALSSSSRNSDDFRYCE